ncbi:single-stranded DNA-binding protein [Agromyces silvae]|uniref:single-stranded DNA-binding protein n=1 Tax=Agromyces silvae TaxID=3388266 RepID=UPI00280BB4F3|nr:single-stranded DNA-binding protein [Agromyces protaetiae]
MTDLITVTGIVGSDPRAIVTGQQLPITSFRLASTRRYFNRTTNSWEDAGTNWYTVSAFRQLAFNANASLRKGEHVLVHGRLKQRPWQAGDRAGVAIEIEADAIGHDLSWGMTQLRRLEHEPRREGGEGGEGGDATTTTPEGGAVAPDAAADTPETTDDLAVHLDEFDDEDEFEGDAEDEDDEAEADEPHSTSPGIAAFAS